MKSIEAEIHNILENQKNNDDISKMDTFRNLYLNLENHIDALAEEVKFLREDSISKSRMINNLIDIAGIRYKKCESNNYSTNSDDFSCDDVTKYNIDFSKNNHNASVPYLEDFLSAFPCGYRKGYSTQYALLGFIEKWKHMLDNRGYAGAILMDLLKAFDTINHELHPAKLYAYGFEKNALR